MNENKDKDLAVIPENKAVENERQHEDLIQEFSIVELEDRLEFLVRSENRSN